MNNLPEKLQEAISKQIEGFSLTRLAAARQDLSQRYRERHHTRFMNKADHRYAYILSRMPATYAVIAKVLKSLADTVQKPIETLLDIGAGPGTVLWSAQELFASLQHATLYESDLEIASLGKEFLQQDPLLAQKTEWKIQNFVAQEDFGTHDLVTASYALSELSEKELEGLLPKLWNCTRHYLVLIEPGTPYGFKVIEKARRFFLAEKGFVLAPCTHAKTCPLVETGGWCHFSERINRSKEERFVKDGQLGYEDEKYAYLMMAKEPHAVQATGRIIHVPQKGSGHLTLSLCTADGIKKTVVSKKQGEVYKQARKLTWGDAWFEMSSSEF